VILWPAKAGSALIGTGARTPRRIRGLMRLAIWREKGKVEILSPCSVFLVSMPEEALCAPTD